MKITTKMIMDWGPCEGYDYNDVDRIIGTGKTQIEVLDLDISVNDKFWVLFHQEIIPVHDMIEFACQFAESVLHVYESRYPNDSRIRDLITATRLLLQNSERYDAVAARAGDAAVDAADAVVAAAAAVASLAAANAASLAADAARAARAADAVGYYARAAAVASLAAANAASLAADAARAARDADVADARDADAAVADAVAVAVARAADAADAAARAADAYAAAAADAAVAADARDADAERLKQLKIVREYLTKKLDENLQHGDN